MVFKPKRKSFSKFCLRAVSSFLLAAMACQDLAYANPEIKLALPEWTVQPLRLDLPGSVAKIEETYKADGGSWIVDRGATSSSTIHDPSSNILVYLLQDAHTNPSAQINIAKTLELLIEKKRSARFI